MILPDDRQYLGPLFDEGWYAMRYARVLIGGSKPILHYLALGRSRGCKPNRAILPNVTPRDPTMFTLQDLHNEIKVVEDAGVFDAEWYAVRYGVPAAEALKHFLVEGAYEGLDPNPFFSSKTYFNNNQDIATAGTNPLWHYILYGSSEGRVATLMPHLLGSLDLDEYTWKRGLSSTRYQALR